MEHNTCFSHSALADPSKFDTLIMAYRKADIIDGGYLSSMRIMTASVLPVVRTYTAEILLVSHGQVAAERLRLTVAIM